MDEAKYNRYIEDFNSACVGHKTFSEFYDAYYEPDAINDKFKYVRVYSVYHEAYQVK